MWKGWLGPILALSVIGCGGGGGGYRATTYALIPGVAETVPAGECIGLEQPASVSVSSTMAFRIDDTPVGIGVDSYEVGIMYLADFNSAGGCNFNLAIVDDPATGSTSDSGPAYPGTYQFVLGCKNIADPCVFTLTWTATY